MGGFWMFSEPKQYCIVLPRKQEDPVCRGSSGDGTNMAVMLPLKSLLWILVIENCFMTTAHLAMNQSTKVDVHAFAYG